MILLIDNYDSFVHNLARYFRRLGQETRVVRNDEIDIAAIRRLQPGGIVLSPGPCTPREAGISLSVVRELHEEFAMLGVCLGHQTIAAAFGGCISRAPSPMHGRTSEIMHDGSGVFRGLANPLTVCRYHSLVVVPEDLPERLIATAHTADGVNMAIAHRRLSVVGVQFHPESILSEGGFVLLANWLQMAGLETPQPLPTMDDERISSSNGVIESLPSQTPRLPVTF